MGTTSIEATGTDKKLIGRYIVADPKICHGKPTFRGTRIMVWQVLNMVAKGEDWDNISTAWVSEIPKEAIAEAISLAAQVFVEQVSKYTVEAPADVQASQSEQVTEAAYVAVSTPQPSVTLG